MIKIKLTIKKFTQCSPCKGSGEKSGVSDDDAEDFNDMCMVCLGSGTAHSVHERFSTIEYRF